MRITEIITERNVNGILQISDLEIRDAVNDASSKIIELLNSQSSQWLREKNDHNVNALRGLAHGTSDHARWAAFTRKTRQDRRPTDSSYDQTTLMNLFIGIAGGIANRNNSLFVTGSSRKAKRYGQLYIVFPLGEYQYTWSPEFSDWYVDFTDKTSINYIKSTPKAHEYAKMRMEEFLKSLQDDPNLGHYEKHYFDYFKGFTDEYFRSKANKDPAFLTNKNIYDPQKIKKDIWVNKGLDIALSKPNEIMLYCKSALYLDPDFYDYAIKDRL